MATKYSSKGASILLSIASVFTAIAQTTEIRPPAGKVMIEQVPDLSSGVGIPKQATGHTDSGTSGGTCYFDPADASQKAITAYLASPAVSSWKITYSDAAPTSWTFSAIVVSFTPTVRYGEFMKAEFELDVTGLVTGW